LQQPLPIDKPARPTRMTIILRRINLPLTFGESFMKPVLRPKQPFFSSGPCAKRPGWTPAVLADACLGRSHRSKAGLAKLKEALDRTRALLGIPADYRRRLGRRRRPTYS
jgi:hypothetical protein